MSCTMCGFVYTRDMENNTDNEIRSYRDLMARNDDVTEEYYSQFTDEEIERRTADIDLH